MAKKILFIDSDETFVQGLSQAATARGHGPLVSTNSEQGITLAKQETPDLIVVCVEAQPTNGYMLCTRLKKDDRLKGIPVILTSANATPDSFEKHKKLKTRAEEYLIKPFNAGALFEKVNKLLGLPAEPLHTEEIVSLDDEPLGIGDLVAGTDEPIQIGDHELVASQGGDDGFLVDEVEEVVQIDEQSASADGDPDLQMFDRAFEALEMPQSKADQHANTAPIATPPHHEAHDEVVHLSQEDAHEAHVAKSGAEVHAAADKSIDDILGSLDGAPAHEGEGGDSAHLHARIAELEQELLQRTAELESAKASAGSSAELLKLKEARNKQDKESLRLKEELHEKDRELIELHEAQTALEAQVQSQRDEAIKREAAAKALQQRAEALAAAAKKFERELTAAREELKQAAALKARHAELERAHGELRSKHEGAEAEVDKALQKLAELQQELEGARELHGAELEGARELHGAELAGARELHGTEVGQVRAELQGIQDQIGKAQEELAAAKAEAQAAQADAQRYSGDLEAVRAELSAAAGERELLRDEREELQGKVSEAQAQATLNEERAVKAYQRIKSDERIRERTRKALTIALQLLDEVPSIDGSAAEVNVEVAKQSA